MHHDPFARYESLVIRCGIFVVFVVTFGDYVIGKIWPVLAGLFE